jgi:hypothetical protein
MKPILAILLSLFSCGLFAQTQNKSDCPREWYMLFKVRGAKPVPDGTQDVIITLQSNDYSECFMGRISVSRGKLIGKLQVQKLDGTYEEFDRKVSSAYQNAKGVLKEELREVTNGMSSAVTLRGGETIRLFFYKYLASTPSSNKKAPPPSELVPD